MKDEAQRSLAPRKYHRWVSPSGVKSKKPHFQKPGQAGRDPHSQPRAAPLSHLQVLINLWVKLPLVSGELVFPSGGYKDPLVNNRTLLFPLGLAPGLKS